MLRRPRTSSQHPTRGGHSDEDEDEGVPASYHTVSLQVSQDVSMAPFTSSPPLHMRLGDGVGPGKARAERKGLCILPRPLNYHLHSIPLIQHTPCMPLLA